MKELIERIFSIQTEEQFERVALEVYAHQSTNCSVYADFIKLLNRKQPTCVEDIPFLPISFFKTHSVSDHPSEVSVEFKSSGTGGDRSSHFVRDIQLYDRAFKVIYNASLGNPKDQVILALLPNYLEQGHSSLVYMVDALIQQTNHPLSGFLLDDLSTLIKRYEQAVQTGKQVVVFGVSYALLDLCELKPNLNKAIIVETGGMKGRRKEMTKTELHETLCQGLNCPNISSEYGMTELLSQAYSKEGGVFDMHAWFKVLIRDVNDPLNYVRDGKTGGINVVDLANLHSCSFIATQDLGRKQLHHFEIMGRFDHSDIRGCNLLVQ